MAKRLRNAGSVTGSSLSSGSALCGGRRQAVPVERDLVQYSSSFACQFQYDFRRLMDRSIRVSCDFELPSHASTTCSAKKGYLEPIICMSPAALMVS